MAASLRRVLLLLVAWAAAVAGVVELRGSKDTSTHPNHFVIVFRANASAEHRDHHFRRHSALADQDPESAIRHNFTINGFAGYAARFSDELLRSARMDEAIVEYIEFDGVVSVSRPVAPHAEHVDTPAAAVNASGGAGVGAGASCSYQNDGTWGLSRISNRDRKVNGKYNYDTTGSSVNAYVLDTGVYVGHSDFGGRAIWGTTFEPNSDGSKTDRNGHGTHCAGTIGSNTYGVAKGVTIVAVQVLSETGSGSMSGVIKGLEWVCQHKQSDGNHCVINLSLSGGYYNAMNDAANAAVSCGCVVVVAAGNDGADACSSSPGSASNVVTVGATTNQDKRSYFSNMGKCVDIFAPGSNVVSTWIGSQWATQTLSGTSMASPHVAGAAARLLGATGASPSNIANSLISSSSTGYLSDLGSNSPNLLLYTGSC